MTKEKITEVRDDLNRLIDALNPGSVRFAVARAVEKLDAILDSLPAEPTGGQTNDQLKEYVIDFADEAAGNGNGPEWIEPRRTALLAAIDRLAEPDWFDSTGKRHRYKCGMNPDPAAIKHMVSHCTCPPDKPAVFHIPGGEYLEAKTLQSRPYCTCIWLTQDGATVMIHWRDDPDCPMHGERIRAIAKGLTMTGLPAEPARNECTLCHFPFPAGWPSVHCGRPNCLPEAPTCDFCPMTNGFHASNCRNR